MNSVLGTSAALEVISGNSQDGVHIVDSGTDRNAVEGVYIGLAPTACRACPTRPAAWPFTAARAAIRSAGPALPSRDVISGNTGDALYIVGSGTTGNVVEGDYIGPAASGDQEPTNYENENGVYIGGGASDNTIGGTVSGSLDLLSGNTSDGVQITGSGTSGNVVEGDFIGTNSTGSSPLANDVGVLVQNGATNNTIGALTVGAPSDVIAGNTTDGVQIAGSGTTGNVVWGDYIGNTGSSALANANNGVSLFDGATNNTIGGTVSGSLNVISGNGNDGVSISGGNERQRRGRELHRHVRIWRERIAERQRRCVHHGRGDEQHHWGPHRRRPE